MVKNRHFGYLKDIIIMWLDLFALQAEVYIVMLFSERK